VFTESRSRRFGIERILWRAVAKVGCREKARARIAITCSRSPFAQIVRLTEGRTPPQPLRASLRSPISAIAAHLEEGMLAADHAWLTASFTRRAQPVSPRTESNVVRGAVASPRGASGVTSLSNPMRAAAGDIPIRVGAIVVLDAQDSRGGSHRPTLPS